MSTAPATPLFRPEVMQAQAGQWLGSIRIGRPLGFSLVTGAAVLMAAGLVSFAIWGEYTRKVTLPGVLMPETGIINLSSNQPATVAEILVREGDWVKAGQPLIKLRAERVVAGVDAMSVLKLILGDADSLPPASLLSTGRFREFT